MTDDLIELFNTNSKLGRRIIDSLPAAIYITDAKGQLQHFNSAAVDFSGQKLEVGDQWCISWKLYYPDGSPMSREESPMLVALKEERSIEGAEVTAKRPDGDFVRFKAYTSPLYNKEGEVIGGINMLVDNGDKKGNESELRSSLEESEQQKRLYEAIISSTPDLVYVFDLNYRFIFANDALLEMWGRSRKESIGKGMREVGYEPWHAEMHEQEIDQVINTKDSVHGEISFPHAKLGERFYDYIFVPVLDDECEVESVAGITRDITERKQAEQALRKSEGKYRTLFESIDEGFCIIKVEFDENEEPIDFLFLEANSSLEKHTGLKEVEGKYVSEVVPGLEEDWFEIYGKVALTGESARYKNYSEEMQRWFDEYAFRIGEPGERKVALLFKDITEQKEAEREREQLLKQVETEEERLSDIFRQAPSFMCIQRGRDHVYERANDLYRELVGGRKLIGKPVREAFPDLEGQGYFKLLDRVYETGEPYIGTDMKVVLEHPNSKREPEERYLDFVYQPLRDPDGEVNGVFTQGVDLTERRKAKEELQEINETLEERVEERTKSLLSYQEQLRSLVSELSMAEERERQRLASELHDNLGQMLAVGKMQVDLLEADHFTGHGLSDINKLKTVMEGAISYTRNLMTELKPPPSLDEEDLLAKIQWVAKKMEKHDLSVIIDDDTRSKPLSKEVQTVVMQCVRELLFNVVKHTSVTEAYVSLNRKNGTIKITVKDKGSGFDPEEISAPTDEGGFGLFNIQERVDMLGGEVDIQSEPETGTEAILSIPLKDSRDSVGSRPEKPEKPERPKKSTAPTESIIKILLADDHQMVREGLRKIIEEQDDMTIIGEAADGEEAVKMTRNTSPDVVLMDVNMPKMDGIEATKIILGKMPRIRIIGLSLHDDKAVVRDMRKAGATAYLTKNEAFESLVLTIRAESSAT